MATTGGSATLNANFNGTYNKSTTVGGNLVQSFAVSFGGSFTDGTGASQFNRYLAASGTATDTPTAAVDLVGTTSDAYGTTTDFAKVRLIVVKNTGATNDLLIGGNGTDIVDLAAVHVVKPGGSAMWYAPAAAGMAVTATTKDKIFVASTTAVTTTYELYVWGST